MSDAPDIEEIQSHASALMKQGIRLLNENASPAEALEYFDRELELHRRLPIEISPVLGFGLAACLLNRADALMRQGSATELKAAIAACDEAIGLLRRLPLTEDPRFSRRLGIAYQNRGLALLAQNPPAASEAIDALGSAIAVFEAEEAASIPDRFYLIAVAWLNLSRAQALAGTLEAEVQARDAARRAMALVANTEGNNPAAAEVGLKARHVLCQTTVRKLSELEPGEPVVAEVHDATDAVDEGLALARLWERKGVTQFQGIACDLFRFGAAVYRRFQPQFFEEFARENADVIPLLREAGGIE